MPYCAHIFDLTFEVDVGGVEPGVKAAKSVPTVQDFVSVFVSMKLFVCHETSGQFRTVCDKRNWIFFNESQKIYSHAGADP